jgi:hypothetical protein
MVLSSHAGHKLGFASQFFLHLFLFFLHLGLTTHNPDGDLESTLRAAEAAVEVALGFSGLKLKEKPMYALAPFAFEGRSREAARQAAVDAASPLQDAEV